MADSKGGEIRNNKIRNLRGGFEKTRFEGRRDSKQLDSKLEGRIRKKQIKKRIKKIKNKNSLTALCLWPGGKTKTSWICSIEIMVRISSEQPNSKKNFSLNFPIFLFEFEIFYFSKNF